MKKHNSTTQQTAVDYRRWQWSMVAVAWRGEALRRRRSSNMVMVILSIVIVNGIVTSSSSSSFPFTFTSDCDNPGMWEPTQQHLWSLCDLSSFLSLLPGTKNQSWRHTVIPDRYTFDLIITDHSWFTVFTVRRSPFGVRSLKRSSLVESWTNWIIGIHCQSMVHGHGNGSWSVALITTPKAN